MGDVSEMSIRELNQEIERRVWAARLEAATKCGHCGFLIEDRGDYTYEWTHLSGPNAGQRLCISSPSATPSEM